MVWSALAVNEASLRQSVVDYCRKLNETGINQGTSGNVSVRYQEGMLISPSGMPYDQMRAEDVVFVDRDGHYRGRTKPSSEWRFHADIFSTRPEAQAVVHAHPTYCTVLAIRRLDIPPLHYMVAAAGGSNIRCAGYATFGTPQLSRNALAALEGRDACLLANHGMIAIGSSLAKALWLAVEVEALARQYVISMQIGGPELLSEAEIQRVLRKFKHYGHRAER